MKKITKIAQLCTTHKSKLYCIISGKFQNKGKLYLSNITTAIDKPLIQNKNIKAIITVAKGCVLPYSKEQVPNYLYIPIEDKSSYNIYEYFQKCLYFIQKNITKSNVLVHCKAGLSRSATIVISYLMIKNNFTLNKAFQYVKNIQPSIKPNKGFFKQLEQLHFQLHSYKQQKIYNMIESKRPNYSHQKTKSLHFTAQKLEIQNQKIVDHIVEIKKLCQDNVLRTRSKSDYLKKKLQQAREKRTDFEINYTSVLLKNIS